MSSTTPIATPAQSPCKAAVATSARVTSFTLRRLATPTAAATKSEPPATTPVARAVTDNEPQQLLPSPRAGSVATGEPHGEDSPAQAALRPQIAALASWAKMGEIDRVIKTVTAALCSYHRQTAARLHEKAHALVQMGGSANLAAAAALYDLVIEIMGADHLETAATLHETVSQPTPLTAIPAPATEVASTMDEPTATTTATDGAPATPDHAAASAHRSMSAVLLGTPAPPARGPQLQQSRSAEVPRYAELVARSDSHSGEVDGFCSSLAAAAVLLHHRLRSGLQHARSLIALADRVATLRDWLPPCFWQLVCIGLCVVMLNTPVCRDPCAKTKFEIVFHSIIESLTPAASPISVSAT
jgi:hypothetical protein